MACKLANTIAKTIAHRGPIPRLRAMLIASAALAAACWSGAMTGPSAAQVREPALRAFIEQNIDFVKDRNNRDALLIRKRPVRALIRAADPALAALARETIANVARAFGLPHEFATTRVNLIVATADRIAEDGKASRPFLQSLGLPEALVDTMVNRYVWSTGCGTHGVGDADGRMTFGLTAADKSLPTLTLNACVVSGVLFGFGLRTRSERFLDDPNEYVKLLALAGALAACDESISANPPAQAADTRQTYLDCAVQRLAAK